MRGMRKRDGIILVAEIFIVLLTMIVEWKRPLAEYNIFSGDMQINENSSLAPCFLYEDGLEINIEDYWFLDEDYENYSDEVKFVLHENISAGVYTLDAKYISDYDTVNNKKPSVVLSVGSDSESNKVKMIPYGLKSNKRVMSEYVFIYPFSSVDEVTARLDVLHAGHTNISQIMLKEYMPARFLHIILLICILLCVDFFIFIVPRWNNRKKIVAFSLLCITLFSSYPSLWQETYAGHDMGFHLGRIISIASELRYGNFPVLYQSDALSGYGYISHIMYGSLFLYFPAILHLLGIPATIAYNMFVIVMNGATSWIAYYCFKKIFNADKWGICGACIYVLSSYRITDLYVRATIGEYIAMTFLPLVVYGIYKIYYVDDNSGIKEHMPLILGISGIIQSHVLTCEILAVFVIVFAFIHLKKTLRLLKYLLRDFIILLGLNAFFIIPFLDSYSMDLIVKSPKEGVLSKIQENGTQLFQVFGLLMSDGLDQSRYNVQGELPLTIGATLVISVVLFIILYIYRKKWKLQENYMFNLIIELFIYSMIAIFVTTCYFPWDDLAKVNNIITRCLISVQVPFRYLSIATVCLTFILVYSLKIICEKVNIDTNMGIIAIISVAIWVIAEFYVGFCFNDMSLYIAGYNTDYFTDVLYMLNGTDTSQEKLNDISVHTYNENIEVETLGTDSKNHKIYNIKNGNQDAVISLPIHAYKYIYVYDEKGEIIPSCAGENNRVQLTIPANYNGMITVKFIIRKLWRGAQILSVIVGCAIIWLSIKKKDRYNDNCNKLCR